jgi:amidase
LTSRRGKMFGAAVVLLWSGLALGQKASDGALSEKQMTAMDRDLMEVTIPRLEGMYANHKYTVTQVVQWYVARIGRYNGIYRAVQDVDLQGALAVAAKEDADAKVGGKSIVRGPMWGVPVVIKANTSIAGQVTTDGWEGFQIKGHELVAPKDATVVAKLKAAGAVILGQTNMPDFAASDTNRSTAFGRTGNAYDVRFSPGGSSGGTVTAVTANMAVLGTGTDTANSIRMPSSTSSVVGVLPTRGLVSIAGIAPLDWLADNTGPIARYVTDAAIALGVMAGEDPLDFQAKGSQGKAESGIYTQYLKADALKGKRFGVPAFIVKEAAASVDASGRGNALRPETRAMFMKAVEELRAAGATVVFDESILPDSFQDAVRAVKTQGYRREGTEGFLKEFGPTEYRTADAYHQVVGKALPATLIGGSFASPTSFAAAPAGQPQRPPVPQVSLESDPQAEANFFTPRKAALAAYNEALERLHLDGMVYPAAQMPPPDETMAQDGRLSGGPHSNTGWVNRIGVPAVVVPGGFYPSGLPFGLEISARQWKDGDLLGWAYAYEQATKHRKPPVLVEKGLLPDTR